MRTWDHIHEPDRFSQCKRCYEMGAAQYRCPVCGSDDRTEHNDEMHAQERAADRR